MKTANNEIIYKTAYILKENKQGYNKLVMEIYYDKAASDYITQYPKKRGYYVRFVPYGKNNVYYPQEIYKCLLHECQRKSKKAANIAMDTYNMELCKTLLNRYCRKRELWIIDHEYCNV